MENVLVAGATGRLGRLVVSELLARGAGVRALARRPERMPAAPGCEVRRADLLDPRSLEGACDGVAAVVSCAGAPMDLRSRERTSFAAVDDAGNRHLLDAARRAGVGKFVYVSLAGADVLAHTAYAAAHERFAAALAASGLAYTVVRPTGFFYFFDEILAQARRGLGFVVGPGTARTNPVHEADVAACCADALAGVEREVAVGGPDVFTRREVVELAFDVAGRAPRVASVPPGVVRGLAVVARPFNPRLAGLLAFGAEVGLVDVLAPPRGRRTMRAYFEERVGAAGAGDGVIPRRER